MTNSEKLKVEKKTYTKPTLTTVRLVAEEAVLGSCKYVNGAFNECLGDPSCDVASAGS